MAKQNSFVTKDLLIESFRGIKKNFSIDLSNPLQNTNVLADEKAFNYYVESLSAPFTDAHDRINIKTMAKGTRETLLMENAKGSLSHYEVLSLPLIPVFYPRLIAKDLITFATTDKVDIIKPIMRAKFNRWNDVNNYDAPSMSTDISRGPTLGVPGGFVCAVPGSTDLLAAAGGLTPASAHIERDLKILEITDGANIYRVDQITTVDGNFYIPVTLGAATDVVTGKVDFLNGTITFSSVNGVATQAKVEATVSIEENTVSSKMEIEIDKIRIPIVDRQIEVSYTVQQKMDVKSLYDVELESIILDLIGSQIALDLDNYILKSLTGVVYNPALVPATHIQQFTKNAPVGYDWGPKSWHENIITPINEISAEISNDTRLGEANVMAANTLNAALLRDLDTYRVDYDRQGKSVVGYKAAEIEGGNMTVIDSPVQEKNKMLLVYKPGPNEEHKSVFYLIMHTPGLVIPYPKGYKPSFSVLTRYGTAFVHHKGLGVLEIT
ncbi:hypothetical protein M0R36_10145 [bacterium]|jgi:hypothetical protein|nr:hypothetical protein [bacterium]